MSEFEHVGLVSVEVRSTFRHLRGVVGLRCFLGEFRSQV